MDKSFKAIDMHTHLNHGVPGDSLGEGYEVYRADLDYLMRSNEHTGIEKMFVSTFSSVLSTERIPEENEYMCRLSQEHESVYQWVVIDPRDSRTLEQADLMLKNKKCVGIKMHPAYHEYTLKDHYETITSLASKHRAILLIHHERGGAETMVRMANEFPEIQIINPHLASKADVEYLIEGGTHGNFWVDTSGIGSSRNAIVEYCYERCGADRMLFGTDTYAAGFQRGRIEYAMIPELAKEKILRYNAQMLFARSL